MHQVKAAFTVTKLDHLIRKIDFGPSKVTLEKDYVQKSRLSISSDIN